MKKTLHLNLLTLFICLQLFLITLSAQRKMETLDRGLVAMKVSSGVFLSWRVLGNEFSNTGYKLYRNGSLIATLSSTDATNYSDT